MAVLKMVGAYFFACILAPILFAIPGAVILAILRRWSPKLGTPLAIVVSLQAAMMLTSAWSLLQKGQLGSVPSVEIIIVAILVAWLAIRPGPIPLVMLVAYEVFFLTGRGIIPFFAQPWNTLLHRVAVATIVLRVPFIVVLLRALRSRRHDSPALAE